MKHTSGPWHVRDFDGSQWSIDASGDMTVAQALQLRPLAFDMKQEERTANARLIAAAPKLLEALQSILPFIPVTSAEEGGASAYSENVRAADKVRAAIARATGETP